jgi:hypothetical protein
MITSTNEFHQVMKNSLKIDPPIDQLTNRPIDQSPDEWFVEGLQLAVEADSVRIILRNGLGRFLAGIKEK